MTMYPKDFQCPCYEWFEVERFRTKEEYDAIFSVFDDLVKMELYFYVGTSDFQREFECKMCRTRWILGKYEMPVKGFLFKKKLKF